MANISAIKLPNNTTYNIVDNTSGYIKSYTDEKLKISAATSGSSYYLLLGNGTSAATRQYDTALQFSGTTGTASGTGGNTMLTLGNSTTSSTDGWRRGSIQLYGYGAYATTLQSGTPTAHRTITFPDKTGTVALTSDIPTVPSNIVNTITTTAGTHTAISSKTGTVSFNVPTKTSHLTNDSGFITASHTSTYSLPLAASGTRGGVQIGYSESGTNYAVKLSSEKMYVTVPWTDTKVTTTPATSDGAYYLTASSSNSGATEGLYKHRNFYAYIHGSTVTNGDVELRMGNATAVGTSGAKQGKIRLYTAGTGYIELETATVASSANRTITFPNASGTVALTTDIPSVPTKVSQLTNDSGYLTGITSAQVTTALGYTPYDSTNPNGYTSNTGTVTGVKINGTTKSPSSGVVDLGTVATSDTNTTYTLSGALSSHKFTSTITAGGSGSGTSTSDFTLAAGSNVTLTDNTSTRTITIAATDTTYSSETAASGGTALSLVTTGEKYTWNNKSNLTIGTTSTTAAAGNHTHTASLATSTGTSSITLASATKYALTAGGSSVIFTMPADTQVTVAENTKSTKYYPILASGTGTSTRQIDTNDKLNSETASGLYYQNAILGTPGLYIGDIEYTITNSEYSTLDSAIDALL